jgi:hypothetical protein
LIMGSYFGISTTQSYKKHFGTDARTLTISSFVGTSPSASSQIVGLSACSSGRASGMSNENGTYH